jgi:hypothetical protein
MQQHFLQLKSGHIIDLSQVEFVSPAIGDPAFRHFEVRFRSGFALEIYESRQGVPGYMDRRDFVEQLLAQTSSSESV